MRRVRRAIEIREQCFDSGPSSTKHGRHDLEPSVLAPPFGTDRVVVRNVRHYPCAGRSAPAAVAENQRTIAEWGAPLRRTILQVFDQAPILTVHRRGRRQQIDHRLCTPIFRLPGHQCTDGVKTEVKHAFEKQFVVGLVEVYLAAVKRTIEGRVDVRPRSGLHLGRQKDHEDPCRSRRRFLDGNPHGDPTDLRPAVRQVLHDSADPRTLIRIILPADDVRPKVKLAGRRVISRRSGARHAQPLPPATWATGEDSIRVDRAFQHATLAIYVDDECCKVMQEDGRPGIQILQLVLDRLHGLVAGARPSTIQTQPDDGHMPRAQQRVHFGRHARNGKRNLVRRKEVPGLAGAIDLFVGYAFKVPTQLIP